MPDPRMTASLQSPWPRRLALWTFLCAVPLVLFGGTVTTLRAGLAESGWLVPDGYFLWLYPLEMRVRDLGTFVEHHHREFGSLVGLLAVALVVTTFARDRRPAARWLAVSALLVISLQGAIGGFRVLERNPDLAFLHGALAHAVFAYLAAVALWFSRGFSAAQATLPSAPVGFSTLTCAVVYAQIVVGAMFRHTQVPLALALHVMLALGVVGAVTRLGMAFGAAARSPVLGDAERRVLQRTRVMLIGLVWTQVALGLLATLMIFQVSGGPEGNVSAGEAVFATLHVAVGAALMAQCVAAALWSRRLCPASRRVPAAVLPARSAEVLP